MTYTFLFPTAVGKKFSLDLFVPFAGLTWSPLRILEMSTCDFTLMKGDLGSAGGLRDVHLQNAWHGNIWERVHVGA